MPGVFDKKIFNAEVFQGYIETLPNPNKNELIKSRAIRPRPDLAAAMADQDGGNYITTTLKGLISGATPKNYDGNTNLTGSDTYTFNHSRVVVGRMNAWTEKDFSYDITGGQDFIQNVAEQIAEYWDEIDQGTIIHILNGVFNMSSGQGAAFVASHTHDISEVTNADNVLGKMDGTSLNTCMQKACGDNKSRFSMAIMHSVVATNLENLKLLVYLKYTDPQGVERDLTLGTLNGRLVMVDDTMPTETVPATYALTADEAVVGGKTYYTRSGSGTTESPYVYTAVDEPATASIANYYEMTAAEHVLYTTYVLGDGAIEYTDCGAKVPYEVDRDPSTNGGQDTLYSRQRKCFAPFGINFTKNSMSSLSPTDAELETGSNWEIVSSKNTSGTVEYLSLKTIPIARIISRG